MPASRNIRDDIAGILRPVSAHTSEALEKALAPLTADPSRAAVFCDIDGVLAGTALQQRLSERAVAAAFVLLLVGSAGVLIF